MSSKSGKQHMPKAKKWERRKKQPDNPFDAGWEASVKMFAAEGELTRGEIGKCYRATLEQKRRDAESDLFRAEKFYANEAARLKAAREAAMIGEAKRNAAVIEAMREAVVNGGAENMSKTIRELKASGALTPDGRTTALADVTARRKLKKEFGISGKPGRRKEP